VRCNNVAARYDTFTLQVRSLARDILVAGEADNGDTAIDSSAKIAMHDHIAVYVEHR
jgi:hypothetical protein